MLWNSSISVSVAIHFCYPKTIAHAVPFLGDEVIVQPLMMLIQSENLTLMWSLFTLDLDYSQVIILYNATRFSYSRSRFC
jgi:hypothetical protein